jgi:hypothetical protein
VRTNEYILPKLHSDLLPYLKDDEINHPLLKLEGGVYPALYQRINQVYEHKKRTLDLPKLPNEWQSYLPHLSINDRLSEFIANEYAREDPEYFQLVGQIWTDFETLGQTSGFLEMMIGLSPIDFDKKLSPNVIYLMTISEREKIAQLPERFTVYRGHHNRLLNGISWTIDPNIAMQYAIGLHGERSISTGMVTKTSIIAVIDRWNESEIIVPTHLISDIKTQDV